MHVTLGVGLAMPDVAKSARSVFASIARFAAMTQSMK